MNLQRRRIIISDIDDDLDDRELLLLELKHSPVEVEVRFFDSCPELVSHYDHSDIPPSLSPSEFPAVILLNGFPKFYKLKDELACLANAPGINQIPVILTVCTSVEESYMRELNLPVKDVIRKPVQLSCLMNYLNS